MVVIVQGYLAGGLCTGVSDETVLCGLEAALTCVLNAQKVLEFPHMKLTSHLD